ncbi:MAG: alpha/beta fold hydrolase [Acidobacteria bacterium]|nr:alpha/beta fold hydrolase [Acidobacteriota bacterium]
MIHGAIEDSHIFYSESGRGLALYLAKQGFDIYVADFRGHGGSRPAISRKSRYGQHEMICEDFPAMLQAVQKERDNIPVSVVAHSWGGVIVSSSLARFPEIRDTVSTLVYFGSKRVVQARNIQKFLKIDLMWKLVGATLCRLYGYLPARRFSMGADNETLGYFRESRHWIRPGDWIDPRDSFNYTTAAAETLFPHTLFIAGAGDKCLGYPGDVRSFMDEHGPDQPFRFLLLSRENGNLLDYDHIDMLVGENAVRDHFPQVAHWLLNPVP